MSRVSEPVTEPEEETAAVSEGLSRDEMFDVLANQRRRCILEFFLRTKTEVEFAQLVDHIAAWENDKSTTEVTENERKRVRTALRQNHLPKMEEAGLIEHREETDVIELTDTFSDLNIYLQVVGGRLPYSAIYLALSTFCAVLFVGVSIGIAPLTLLPEHLWLGLTVASFGFTSLVHLYYTRHSELGADLLSDIEE